MAVLRLNPLGFLRYQQLLGGAVDGQNRVYTTPDKFRPDSISVFLNGHRLEQVDTPSTGLAAFSISESGGAGSGYDTVTFRTISPPPRSILWADYILA